MEKNISEIIMNPVRLRIAQYLMIHKTGTTKEIKEELSDVPPASLYRHIKTLADAGLIEVTDEKRIRGTIEKTYSLVKNPFPDAGNQDYNGIIQNGLLMLMSSFEKYFSDEHADPQKDMLTMSTSALMLTDEEMIEVLQKFGAIIADAMKNATGEGRKPRQFTIISSPTEVQ
ncbi:MAG: helix-turn-helix domain-containing protein [Oscillospiraceae bacterium]|nr:helix-turn-helix domain-containing protein [Oscillospiraceae bacterium]